MTRRPYIAPQLRIIHRSQDSPMTTAVVSIIALAAVAGLVYTWRRLTTVAEWMQDAFKGERK